MIQQRVVTKLAGWAVVAIATAMASEAGKEVYQQLRERLSGARSGATEDRNNP